MLAAEPADHNRGEQAARNSLAVRFSWVVARPGPSSVLASTHAPWFDAFPPGLRTYHTTRVVDAYGESTVAAKAICVGWAELPAPRVT